MKGVGGCFLVFLGILGIFLSIVISFTFYLLPLAFLVFLGSLILISYGLGPAVRWKNEEVERDERNGDEASP
ncbi:MAG: hypothetical protein ACE5HN_01770 [Nitrospiria bacterium]